MKQHLSELITEALNALIEAGQLSSDISPRIQIDRTRDKEHGDLASNVALTLAKAANMPPRQLAELICDALPNSGSVSKTEIAGPGFINFFMNHIALTGVVNDILYHGERYGHLPQNPEHEITVEFVSANPTGPLHVGHGRGAAYGMGKLHLLV